MSLSFTGDPRIVPMDQLDDYRRMALTGKTFPGESVMRLMEHVEYLMEHNKKLASGLRYWSAEAGHLHDFVADHGLEAEFNEEMDRGQDR